nr:PKD domain-containing protein [uncultured Desulfobulbus sp.]
MDCSVSLTTNPTQFTLTALFSDGTESPHSSPFTFYQESGAEDENSPGGSVPASEPVASVSTSVALGICPLEVEFDGSGSSDPSGEELSEYLWDFGNQHSATGEGVTYVFEEPGTYTVTLTVTNLTGETASVTTPIVVVEAQQADPTTVSSPSTPADLPQSNELSFVSPIVPADEVHLEAGSLRVTDAWARVSFDEPYTTPVVIAGAPSFEESDPCTVQLRNITTEGFDIRLAEWEYLDGEHTAETVNYLVLEQGINILEDGSVINAGVFQGSSDWQEISFFSSFEQPPLLLTSIASMHGGQPLIGRSIPGKTSFGYLLQAAENKQGSSELAETVHYIAWEAGVGGQEAMLYEAVPDALFVNNDWRSVDMQRLYMQVPYVWAAMQSKENFAPATVRIGATSCFSFKAKIEEEQSADSEIKHPYEQVGYLAIVPNGPKQLATFTWEFDASEEALITGFRVLADGEEICVTADTSARAMSCTILKPTQQTVFTIVAAGNENEESKESNSLTYIP